MPSIDPHLRRLYVTTFLFGMACGISIALSSILLDGRGLSKQEIGDLASLFALGIAAFAIPASLFIKKFTAKRTLTAATIGYALSVSLFPFMPGFWSIAGIRFFDGACSACIWVSSETILLMRARKEYKAYLTTLYGICLGAGYVLGPGVALGVTQFFPQEAAFLVAGAFALSAVIYGGLRIPPDELLPGAESEEATSHEPAEATNADTPTPMPSILWRIKTSCFGTYAYGHFQASAAVFLPLFLMQSKGISRVYAVLMVLFFSLGMLSCANIVGRLGDRYGHLRVMRVLATLGALCAVGFVLLDTYWLMCCVVFISGAALGSMSGVSLALQGIVTRARDYRRANAAYNVFYAAGMVIGPRISGALFDKKGGEAMLYQLSGLWVVFVLFTIVFMNDDPRARKARENALPPAAGVA